MSQYDKREVPRDTPITRATQKLELKIFSVVNSFLLLMMTGIGGFFANRLWAKMDTNNDILHETVVEVRSLKDQLNGHVSRREYDLQMSDIKARLANVELELQRMKGRP